MEKHEENTKMFFGGKVFFELLQVFFWWPRD